MLSRLPAQRIVSFMSQDHYLTVSKNKLVGEILQDVLKNGVASEVAAYF